MWWAYGRKDSARAHEFRLASAGKAGDDSSARAATNGSAMAAAVAASPWPHVVKIMPVTEDGRLALGSVATSGELLADQAAALMRDPDYKANLTVKVPTETDARVAGQISQLLVQMLTRGAPTKAAEDVLEVIVAPNSAIREWSGAEAVRVTALELVAPSGKRELVELKRPVFILEASIERAEMRSFLEQCEAMVVATGDQSVAEAVLLGKVPLARPDAKAAQWELALASVTAGKVADVPDLGALLRRLVASPSARASAAAASEAASGAVEARAVAALARLGRGRGAARGAAQETLLRAGMFG